MKINCKGKRAEILIYEDIGEGWFGGISAKTFADEVKKLGKMDEINVRINSAGGNVFDGVAIYNTLIKNPARVTVDIDGLAASIASIIAMAGDEITIAANGFVMIHDPWIVAMGNANELRETAETLDKVRGTLLDTYVRRSTAKADEIDRMMAEETWLTAQEALDAGLVDKITDEQRMAASIDKRLLAKFRSTPKSLIEQIEEVEEERPRLAALAHRLAHMDMVLRQHRI